MRYGYELLRDGPYLRVVLPDVLPPDWRTLRREVGTEIDDGANRVVLVASDGVGSGSDGARLDEMVASLRNEGVDAFVVWDESYGQGRTTREEVGSMSTKLENHTPVDVKRVTVPDAMPEDTPDQGRGLGVVWGVLRLLMGWTFLWAFVDKMFGLGFATGRDADTGAIVFGGPDAWVNGGSPTAGVLGFAVKGPFKGFYQSLTGFQMGAAGPTTAAWVDWVFMLSMLAIGLALILGIGVKLASIGGAIWMVIFYTATAIWPEHNPFVDEHVIMFVVLIGLFLANAGRYLGFGRWWQDTALVRKYPILS